MSHKPYYSDWRIQGSNQWVRCYDIAKENIYTISYWWTNKLGGDKWKLHVLYKDSVGRHLPEFYDLLQAWKNGEQIGLLIEEPNNA